MSQVGRSITHLALQHQVLLAHDFVAAYRRIVTLPESLQQAMHAHDKGIRVPLAQAMLSLNFVSLHAFHQDGLEEIKNVRACSWVHCHRIDIGLMWRGSTRPMLLSKLRHDDNVC